MRLHDNENEPTERRDAPRADTTERRLDGHLRILKFGAVLCAIFAALGIGHGIYEANPEGGLVIPVLAGLVAATAFAAFWHVLIGAITGMVRRSMIIGTFMAGFVLTVVALGASAQSIATAISGHAAVSAELAENVDTYNQSLADAYREATRWEAVPNAALATATGLELQAETEASGANGKGAGKGPRYASLISFAQSFRSAADQLNTKLGEAGETRDAGNEALSEMRDAAAHADQVRFMEGAEGVVRAVAELNTVDPMPIVHSVGVVKASDDAFSLTTETEKFYTTAEESMKDRAQVKAPTFAPFSIGDATRRQVLGTAMHGWILASAIDVVPFIFLIVAFLMSREVWHNEKVPRRRLSPMDKDARDRKVLTSMQGAKGGQVAEPAKPLASAERVDQAA